MAQIKTKAEIISGLQESSQRAQGWFTGIPAADFFTRQGEVWSASDNVDHMIKAIKPIAKAMGLPALALTTMFGKPKKHSITYDELCTKFKAKIAKGARASGNFLPDQERNSHRASRRM